MYGELASGDSLYNYFRDYNPKTGRYIESDPIGLDGGINNYSYVGSSPARWADPFGLRTELIGWDPVGLTSSSFGHLSTNINGKNYSFAPGGWDTLFPGASDYAKRQMSFRAGRGVVLDLSPEQEAALETCLKSSQAPYSAGSNNCATSPRDCLNKIGVDTRGFYPDQMIRFLRNSDRSKGNTFYPGPYSSPQDKGAYSR